jgi:hypothetical protein
MCLLRLMFPSLLISFFLNLAVSDCRNHEHSRHRRRRSQGRRHGSQRFRSPAYCCQEQSSQQAVYATIPVESHVTTHTARHSGARFSHDTTTETTAAATGSAASTANATTANTTGTSSHVSVQISLYSILYFCNNHVGTTRVSHS